MGNPLDTVERVIASNDWSFERSGDDGITIFISGRCAEYQACYTWMEDIEALHISCGFELKVPPHRLDECRRLVCLINGLMWVGHFDLWVDNGMVIFRHALLLPGEIEATTEQCNALLHGGLEACEAYFPAFQFVVWAGKLAQEALDGALFETQGEA